jgi:hypothetical protein
LTVVLDGNAIAVGAMLNHAARTTTRPSYNTPKRTQRKLQKPPSTSQEDVSFSYTLLWSFTGVAIIRCAQTEKKNKFCIAVWRYPAIVVNFYVNLARQISFTNNDPIDKTGTNNKNIQSRSFFKFSFFGIG